MAGPRRLRRFAHTNIVRRFTRGREKPRGVVWFGVRSFWGHMRHLIASAIATEDVDSRDWMAADDPRQLSQRVSRLLGSAGTALTVTENLGRDVWIDYLADTGDDAAVSAAVAAFVFSDYVVPDEHRPGAELHAPRGDILLFGGDTAYPVATADEIANRVLGPFNRVLQRQRDGKLRVLLGIPGNHDWYDGLDGFGRMFRRRLDYAPDGAARATLHGSSKTLIGHYAAWAMEFVRGGQVSKPNSLDLLDYVAVQGASYFALPIAPGLVMLGVDRQLKQIDFRQQQYFATFLNQNLSVAPWIVLPDPVHAFGEPSETGVGMIRSLQLTLAARPHLALSGDIHHYRREEEGPTLHITAGGGGAFLHPAPVAGSQRRGALAEWPSVAQSRSMLGQVPWKIGLGRSGILPHLALGALFAPIVFSDGLSALTLALASVGLTFVAGLAYALIGGARKGGAATWILGFMAGAATATLPVAVSRLHQPLHAAIGAGVVFQAALAGVLLVVAFVAVFIFGVYLALLTRFGLENTQAFTALDHPGFKHFVRFRVHADGSRVDGWCIGVADPCAPDAEPVLVDSFTWRSR